MKLQEALVYNRIAVELLKRLQAVDDDALAEEDVTTKKLEAILEAFQHVDMLIKSNGNQTEHLPEDSGAIN